MVLDCRSKHGFGLLSEPGILFNNFESLRIVAFNPFEDLIPKFVSPLDQVKISFISFFEDFVLEDHLILGVRFDLGKIIHVELV